MQNNLMLSLSNSSNVSFKGISRKGFMQILSQKEKTVKTQLQNESILCKYGFLIRMNNELGFKIRHGAVKLDK